MKKARLLPQNKQEFERCIKMGILNPEKPLTIDEIVKEIGIYSLRCVFSS